MNFLEPNKSFAHTDQLAIKRVWAFTQFMIYGSGLRVGKSNFASVLHEVNIHS